MRVEGLAGGAVLALLIVGTFGVIGAVFGAFTMNWTAVGVCLIASAIAFSGIASSLLRR